MLARVAILVLGTVVSLSAAKDHPPEGWYDVHEDTFGGLFDQGSAANASDMSALLAVGMVAEVVHVCRAHTFTYTRARALAHTRRMVRFGEHTHARARARVNTCTHAHTPPHTRTQGRQAPRVWGHDSSEPGQAATIVP